MPVLGKWSFEPNVWVKHVMTHMIRLTVWEGQVFLSHNDHVIFESSRVRQAYASSCVGCQVGPCKVIPSRQSPTLFRSGFRLQHSRAGSFITTGAPQVFGPQRCPAPS